MADLKSLAQCPVCGQKSLVAHCADKHPTCNWHKCRNLECDAVLDIAKGSGHCLEPDGKRRRRVHLGSPS